MGTLESLPKISPKKKFAYDFVVSHEKNDVYAFTFYSPKAIVDERDTYAIVGYYVIVIETYGAVEEAKIVKFAESIIDAVTFIDLPPQSSSTLEI